MSEPADQNPSEDAVNQEVERAVQAFWAEHKSRMSPSQELLLIRKFAGTLEGNVRRKFYLAVMKSSFERRR